MEDLPFAEAAPALAADESDLDNTEWDAFDESSLYSSPYTPHNGQINVLYQPYFPHDSMPMRATVLNNSTASHQPFSYAQETDQAVGMYQHTSSNLQYTALSFATATFMNSFGPLMDPLARHVPVDAAHFANNFGPEANPAVHHGSVPSVSNITIFEQASNTPMNHAPTKQTKRKRAKQDQKLVPTEYKYEKIEDIAEVPTLVDELRDPSLDTWIDRDSHPFEGLKTALEIVERFQAVCSNGSKGFRLGKACRNSGQLQTLETRNGIPRPARYALELVYEQAEQGIDLRKGSNGEEYLVPKEEGDDSTVKYDVTAFLQKQQDWSEDRDHRPEILFQYREFPKRKQYKRSQADDIPFLTDNDGIVLLSADRYPIKDQEHMPFTISSLIPGWHMEAIRRLNSKVGLFDFTARMTPSLKQKDDGTYKDGRPDKRVLNQRVDRARMTMRFLPWPEPTRGRQVHSTLDRDVGDWGRTNNTTRHLKDLTRDQRIETEAAAYGNTALQNAGKNKLSDSDRIAKIQTAIQRYKNNGLSDDSPPIQAELAKIHGIQQGTLSVSARPASKIASRSLLQGQSLQNESGAIKQYATTSGETGLQGVPLSSTSSPQEPASAQSPTQRNVLTAAVAGNKNIDSTLDATSSSFNGSGPITAPSSLTKARFVGHSTLSEQAMVASNQVFSKKRKYVDEGDDPAMLLRNIQPLKMAKHPG